MAVAGERDADDLARPVSFAGVDRAAHQAMEAGDWPTAKTSFEAALELEETAEALLGLGGVPWWLKDTDGSLRCRERAYAAFRRRPDPFLAAGTAFQLAEHFVRPPGAISTRDRVAPSGKAAVLMPVKPRRYPAVIGSGRAP